MLYLNTVKLLYLQSKDRVHISSQIDFSFHRRLQVVYLINKVQTQNYQVLELIIIFSQENLIAYPFHKVPCIYRNNFDLDSNRLQQKAVDFHKLILPQSTI